MDFEGLAPELKEKARACKTPEELMALVQAEGVELSDEQLEAVSGGVDWIDDCTEVGACPEYSGCARY